MEIRNLQKTGGASYNITLPKEWIKSLHLTEKDQIEIFFQNKHQLGIKPHLKHPVFPAATFFVNNLSKQQIRREIISYYLSGVSEINIHATPVTYELRSLVRSVSYKLTGFEIFDTTNDKISLKNVSTNTIGVREYIVNMTNIITSMYEDMKTCMSTNDVALARDIIDRDIEVDRIELVIIRNLNILLYSLNPTESSDIFLLDGHYYEFIAIHLERIADHIVKIASSLLHFKENEKLQLNKPEKDSISREYKNLLECNRMIKTLDKHKAHELLDLYESIDKNDLFTKKNGDKRSINILLEDSIERIRSYIANIAEETVNYYAVKSTHI